MRLIRSAVALVGATLLCMVVVTTAGAYESAPVPHYERRPTVRREDAEALTLKILHNDRTWRRRIYGEVDCSHGRVNRYIYRCRVYWLTRSIRCWKGKVSVEGQGWKFEHPRRAYFRGVMNTRDVCN